MRGGGDLWKKIKQDFKKKTTVVCVCVRGLLNGLIDICQSEWKVDFKKEEKKEMSKILDTNNRLGKLSKTSYGNNWFLTIGIPLYCVFSPFFVSH